MTRLLLLILLSPLASCFVAPSPLVAVPRVTKSLTQVQLSEESSSDETATDLSSASADRTSGLLVLASVPLAWGTYSPVVKYLYEVQPAVPGIVFSAAYYILASVVLNVLCATTQQNNDSSNDTQEDFPFAGGLELGSYLFIANALQVKGLETVPSGRAGFIVQLTTIMVPLLSAFMNNVSVPIRTWIACFLAFAGVVVMGLDGKEMGLSIAASLTSGDLLIVGAAVLYSLHVVRLSRYAMETTPLKLAASKATTEAFLSIGVVSALFFTNVGGNQVSDFVDALSTGWASGAVTLTTLTPAICAVFWTGFVTCAYTIYAQSYGQARVAPTEANLIYTIQPLFTAFFAYLLLGETLGPAGGAGAGLIALAVYFVSNQGDNNEPGNDDEVQQDVVEQPLQVDEPLLKTIER